MNLPPPQTNSLILSSASSIPHSHPLSPTLKKFQSYISAYLSIVLSERSTYERDGDSQKQDEHGLYDSVSHHTAFSSNSLPLSADSSTSLMSSLASPHSRILQKNASSTSLGASYSSNAFQRMRGFGSLWMRQTASSESGSTYSPSISRGAMSQRGRSNARHSLSEGASGLEQNLFETHQWDPLGVSNAAPVTSTAQRSMKLCQFQVRSQSALWRQIKECTPTPRIMILLHTSPDNISSRLSQEPLLQKVRHHFGVFCFVAALKVIQKDSSLKDAHSALHQHCTRNRINLTLGWQEHADNSNTTEHSDQNSVSASLATLCIVNAENACIRLNMHSDLDVWNVAKMLVDYILLRENVHWFRTISLSEETFTPLYQQIHSTVSEPSLTEYSNRLLQFAQNANLFSSKHKGGNVSIKLQNTKHLPQQMSHKLNMLITPRQQDKSSLKKEDFVFASACLKERMIHCCARKAHFKSSIDTGVLSALYHRFPFIHSSIHFHYCMALVIPQACTSFGYPCGCIEEADEIYRTLSAARLQDAYKGGSFMVEMKNHGYLLGLTEDLVNPLLETWKSLRKEYDTYMDENTSSESPLSHYASYPMFVEHRIVGVVSLHTFHRDAEDCMHMYVSPNNQSHLDAFLMQVEKRMKNIMILHGDNKRNENLSMGTSRRGRSRTRNVPMSTHPDDVLRVALQKRGWTLQRQHDDSCDIYECPDVVEERSLQQAHEANMDSLIANGDDLSVTVHYEIGLVLCNATDGKVCATQKTLSVPTLQVTKEEYDMIGEGVPGSAGVVSVLLKELGSQLHYPLNDLLTPLLIDQFDSVNVLQTLVRRKYLVFLVWSASSIVNCQWTSASSLEEPFRDHVMRLEDAMGLLSLRHTVR
uniref:Class II aldolase/adducin N-terminal domain-containing protein n=1 Tax=Percolomonas cosmopolitus TaxID=63605 RepID=A0A7S1KQR3_9EUKA